MLTLLKPFRISKQLSFSIKPSAIYTMNVFTLKLNGVTGKCDWEEQHEDYDFHQEIARSSFADMLHDTERNQKYEAALKVAIDTVHSLGKKALVLDIGTGTGLLSMMAVRNGADCVTACEAFKPMSVCALDVIKANGMEGKIKVIPKRSTEVIVGETGDMLERANILVTEVFDTELIGEGALRTFKEAHDTLLQKDCIVVPHSATIYAQIVDSPFIQNWNRLKNIFCEDGNLLVKIPEVVKNCPGAAAVHDLQISQLPLQLVKSIVAPQAVLNFDFSGKTPFIFERSTVSTLKAQRDGTAHAVLMWWDLKMDIDNKIILSCAPIWAHPNREKGQIPWRDHWMQAVYYFPKEIHVKEKEEVHLISCHDEYSLWFNLKKDIRLSDADYLRPICECVIHMALSRTRIGQINDGRRIKKYTALLQQYIHSDSVVLVLGNACYVGLTVAKLGAKEIYILETDKILQKILRNFIEANQFKKVKIIESTKELTQLQEIDVVFSEPYFTTTILPWHNLNYAYLLKEVKPFLKENVKIFPSKVAIKAIAVQFNDLHKIRIPLGSCEGFTMQPFDELIEKSSKICDSEVEVQPLWEYPARALSQIEEICRIDVSELPKNTETNGIFDIDKCGKCNGIALWMDWIFESESKEVVIGTGPIIEPEIGDNIQWDVHTRQGVSLFQEKEGTAHYSFRFVSDGGEINFTFN